MKRFSLLVLVLITVFSMAAVAVAADKEAIKKQVDEIVTAINNGKSAEDFKDAAKNKPYYVFIMEEDGKLLVHPTMEGQNLSEKAPPVYEALTEATPEGNWVSYEWQGSQKHTYVRKTDNGLIVGSGYTE